MKVIIWLFCIWLSVIQSTIPLLAHIPKESALALTPKGDKLFKRLVYANERRAIILGSMTSHRIYTITNNHNKQLYHIEIYMDYRSAANGLPAKKTYRIGMLESNKYNWFLKAVLLRPIWNTEIHVVTGQDKLDSAITPRNYWAHYVGTDRIDGKKCYILHIHPVNESRYLQDSDIWIDAIDFAIVKIKGQPAKLPSSLLRNVTFTQEYQKINWFWLPKENSSTNTIRVGSGTKVFNLTITYLDYQFQQ